ncbi:MAG: hypothetical protein KDA96_18285, partial [Planctomycetaceae bacterium]|nr:hypothetical protein [Planctomycetaceae bacterium]
MRRHGFLVATLMGATAAGMWLMHRHNDLGASEEARRSFREAYSANAHVETDAPEAGTTRINYFDSSWDRVLSNLAEQNQLTLVMDRVPPGRFSRRDRAEYSVEQAVRILNSELESQGYRLLVQGPYLVVLNLDQARTEYARPRLGNGQLSGTEAATELFSDDARVSPERRGSTAGQVGAVAFADDGFTST